MKKMRNVFIYVLILIMSMSITSFADSDTFDEDNIDSGTIGVQYTSNERLKVMIKHEDDKYVYDLNGDGEMIYFPLQMGNGEYKVYVYQNTSGTKYKKVASKSFTIDIEDENSIYLNAMQLADYDANPETVKKAIELTEDVEDLNEKIEILWKFVVLNDNYNYEKLDTLTSTYIPKADDTLETGDGICYDFSSLLATMLRHEGIPAKLVKGYAPSYAVGYHAWNEVYDADQEKWIVVDSTYDIQTNDLMDYYTFDKDYDSFEKVYEY